MHWEGHTFPKVSDGREVCIKLHSKRECIHDCLRSHVPLYGQVRADYIRFLKTTGKVMRPTPILRSRRAVSEVEAPTWMVGNSSSMDA